MGVNTGFSVLKDRKSGAYAYSMAEADPDNLFDTGDHPRAKLGFVLLATEQTVEDDMFRARPEGVGLHFSRAWNPDSVSVATFDAQLHELSRAARTLLPDGSLDVIGYACTSGSLVMGEARVFAELRKGAPGAIATSLITGVIRALRHLGIGRVAVATPYRDEINQREAAFIEDEGVRVTALRGLRLERDSDMIRVRPEAIADLARSVDSAQAEAVFISCGALRSMRLVDALERELGKPVICSNQAMLWDMLRLAGVGDRIPGYGRLLLEC